MEEEAAICGSDPTMQTHKMSKTGTKWGNHTVPVEDAAESPKNKNRENAKSAQRSEAEP